MIPWREQVRMAWRGICWVIWQKNEPVWVNVLALILIATAMVCVAAGLLWGYAAVLAVALAGGCYRAWERRRR